MPIRLGDFNHSLEDIQVQLPGNLQYWTFDFKFNQSYEGIYPSGGLQILIFGHTFTQNLKHILNIIQHLHCEQSGDNCRFYTAFDDGSLLYLNGGKVVNTIVKRILNIVIEFDYTYQAYIDIVYIYIYINTLANRILYIHMELDYMYQFHIDSMYTNILAKRILNIHIEHDYMHHYQASHVNIFAKCIFSIHIEFGYMYKFYMY